jgi:dolichol-phosphate mannosyltransferase
VLAARDTRDDPGPSSLFADCFYALFRRLALSNMPRRGFDFFLIDRRVCDLINGMPECNPYLMGQILWLGFMPTVLTYHRAKREQRYGESMWTIARRLKYGVDAFVAFSGVPIRIVSCLGLGLTSLGVIDAARTGWSQFFSLNPVQGGEWLTVLFLVVSGIQLLATGIMGEYLWRNLEETRRRPRYIVETIDQPAFRRDLEPGSDSQPGKSKAA